MHCAYDAPLSVDCIRPPDSLKQTRAAEIRGSVTREKRTYTFDFKRSWMDAGLQVLTRAGWRPTCSTSQNLDMKRAVPPGDLKAHFSRIGCMNLESATWGGQAYAFPRAVWRCFRGLLARIIWRPLRQSSRETGCISLGVATSTDVSPMSHHGNTCTRWQPPMLSEPSSSGYRRYTTGACPSILISRPVVPWSGIKLLSGFEERTVRRAFRQRRDSFKSWAICPPGFGRAHRCVLPISLKRPAVSMCPRTCVCLSGSRNTSALPFCRRGRGLDPRPTVCPARRGGVEGVGAPPLGGG